MPKKYQNKSEVVVEAPQDWLLRWDANTANLTYITDEATNDVASWIGEEGPEGLGALTLLNTSVVSLYPEYVRDADGFLCIHCQDDGGLAVANILAANAALHARIDDATNVTVFVVGMNNDPSGDEAGNAYAWHGVNNWRLGNVGLDASLDSYCNGAFRTAANTFDARRYIASYRNLHNGTDDNDVETWVGKTSLYSVAATTDAAVSGGNNLTIGTYATGSSAIWDSDCNIYEIRIYGRTLTDGEHAAVVDELSAKWQTTNADNATDVITEPLNTFPQDFYERWDATTSSGMSFITDEATGDCDGWLGEAGNIWFVDSPGTNYPVWTPGKMTFAGSGDKALYTTNLTSTFSGNPRAVFTAGRINTASPTNGAIFAGPTAYIRMEDLADVSNFNFNDGTSNSTASTNNLLDTPIACGYSTDTTDINWWWGANSKNTDTVSGGTFNETLLAFHVGGANTSSTTTMDGEVYEVIVYDRHVTDAEAERILNYLSHKWGAQNEDSASSVIATYDGLGHTWKSDGPDPQGLQLEGFTPINHSATPLRNADAPRMAGSDQNFYDDRFPSSLPNLRAWYRSDHTGDMTFDSGDAVSGGVVSSWTDITGNFTMNTTSSGDAAVDYRVGVVRGGFPSVEGGTAASPKSLQNTVTLSMNGATGQQRLYWTVGTIGDASKSTTWGGPNNNLLGGVTYSVQATDQVAKPLCAYMSGKTTTYWDMDYAVASGGPPADDGRIHILVYRTTDTGTNCDVETWYAGLKLPLRESNNLDGASTAHAVGAFATSNFDAHGAQFLEMGVCGSPSATEQLYSDQNVEDLIQYLCARYNVDYMPEETPVTIGCWSRQTSANSQTDTCLWFDPSTMTPTEWALHPYVAALHTTPADFSISPPTGAVELEQRTGTLGKQSLRSTEGMSQHMESANTYTSTETTDFPADTLGMSTFLVVYFDNATVAASGARSGNQIVQARFSGTSDTTVQVLASNTSQNWTKANKWLILGNTYAYDDDGTGTEGYPGSTDGNPGAYFYCNDEAVKNTASPAATTFAVENWLNWDISDGVVNMSEIVTFKHPLSIEEITELKKYFHYKYNHLFDT